MKSPKIYTSLKVSSLKKRGRHMVGDLWKYLVQTEYELTVDSHPVFSIDVLKRLILGDL